MFGSRKKFYEEQNRKLIEELSQKREKYESETEEIREAGNRILNNLAQVEENTKSVEGYAQTNVRETTILLAEMDELRDSLGEMLSREAELHEAILEQKEEALRLVEANKHATSPAKALQEATVALKAENEKLKQKLQELSSEERDGEKVDPTDLRKILQELDQSASKMGEFEEAMGRLLSIVKESNIAATRLLKRELAIDQAAKAAELRDFVPELASIRDRIVGIRNAEEEISKCSERDCIQIADIREEMEQQKTQIAEIDSDLSYMMDALSGNTN